MLNLKKIWRRKPTILVYIDLIQDLDLILPLLKAINIREDLALKICLSDWVVKKSPRVENTLKSLGFKYSIVFQAALKRKLQPCLVNIDALITASETNNYSHQYPHLLTQRANQVGIHTYTLQHGFENIGLTYFDEIDTPNSIKFASQKIFIWGNLNSLSPAILPDTKSRCIPVGCLKEIISTTAKINLPHQRDYLIAIFENLHWHRYSNNYRSRFLKDLETIASQFLDTTFLVKPHHAGKWLTKQYKGEIPRAENLVIANPAEPQWEPFTAPALMQYADGIITTPSTVALDAARLKRPVSVIGYDLALPNYQPLPIINGLEDWTKFIKLLRSSEGRKIAEKQARDFVKKAILPGNAVGRILEVIQTDISHLRGP